MAKVTGLGGIFFKARDPQALSAWYREHLGLDIGEWGGAMYPEDASRPGYMLWSPFKEDTTYFAPSDKPFMVNFRVDDLDALLAQLREAGQPVEDRVEESEFGKFGWVMDPEGTRVELWQPPAGD
ncbi:VOC family protein [Oleiagrimonas soli]|uniref:Catechol 2,3-dioxygenase-like lactoylglutathione lyase family enzyme n=1 Tax=Oleiagrimonas soli TaxID=1543381 RepID=A0A099CY98_9GAMM|nr:VOC family protein [Oleiagrimonas soli]KGI78641.1 glyoxalase [Oleiagrimonas soli]MBB6184057.1 catechol 2,3-dioxygenase-like lactoylglutathione lyase family enzyme [Oleiagrimonas soli]